MNGNMNLERKFAPVEGQVTLEDGRIITGYASWFGVEDTGRDVVEAGAYCDSLARMSTEGRRVKMLWQHDPSEPIGVWDEVREDAKGLWVKGRILNAVARGREAAALARAGQQKSRRAARVPTAFAVAARDTAARAPTRLADASAAHALRAASCAPCHCRACRTTTDCSGR